MAAIDTHRHGGRGAARRPPAVFGRAECRYEAIRAWFDEQGFIEVETGILQISPGNETHLHAPRTN